jgi:1,4-dihydroxy-2-naphthoate octaprenyltransferase
MGSMIGLAFAILLGVAYSAWLKRTPFSWLPYALAYPSIPLWVWVSLGRPVQQVLVVSLIATPLAVSVHMVNQLRDCDEDLNSGIRGVVQVLGRPRAVWVCFGLLLLGPIPALILQPLVEPQGLGLMFVPLASTGC